MDPDPTTTDPMTKDSVITDPTTTNQDPTTTDPDPTTMSPVSTVMNHR